MDRSTVQPLHSWDRRNRAWFSFHDLRFFKGVQEWYIYPLVWFKQIHSRRLRCPTRTNHLTIGSCSLYCLRHWNRCRHRLDLLPQFARYCLLQTTPMTEVLCFVAPDLRRQPPHDLDHPPGAVSHAPHWRKKPPLEPPGPRQPAAQPHSPQPPGPGHQKGIPRARQRRLGRGTGAPFPSGKVPRTALEGLPLLRQGMRAAGERRSPPCRCRWGHKPLFLFSERSWRHSRLCQIRPRLRGCGNVACWGCPSSRLLGALACSSIQGAGPEDDGRVHRSSSWPRQLRLRPSPRFLCRDPSPVSLLPANRTIDVGAE